MGCIIKVNFAPRNSPKNTYEDRCEKSEKVDNRVIIDGRTEVFSFKAAKITWVSVAIWLIGISILIMAIWR